MIKPEILNEVGLSALLFVAVWAILSRYLFKPFFAVLAEREARTVGDERATAKSREEAQAVQVKIENELRAARLKGISQRDSKVNLAKAQGQTVIAEAQERAQQQLEKARNEIEALKAKARGEIHVESERLAQTVVERVLASGSGPVVH